MRASSDESQEYPTIVVVLCENKGKEGEHAVLDVSTPAAAQSRQQRRPCVGTGKQLSALLTQENPLADATLPTPRVLSPKEFGKHRGKCPSHVAQAD